MSKEVADILGRMQGNVLALKGVYTKLVPPVPPSSPTIDQIGPAPKMAPEATYEDYEYVQKLLDEIAGQAESASKEIDKILQVPPGPGEVPASGQKSTSPSPPETKDHKK